VERYQDGPDGSGKEKQKAKIRTDIKN